MRGTTKISYAAPDAARRRVLSAREWERRIMLWATVYAAVSPLLRHFGL
jgi:hypothetical protein